MWGGRSLERNLISKVEGGTCKKRGTGQAGTVRSGQVGGRWHGPVYSNEREKMAMNNLNRKDARPREDNAETFTEKKASSSG